MTMNYVPPQNKQTIVRLTGAVYTPRSVAEAVVRTFAEDLPVRQLTVLEPSVGDGAFLEQLCRLMPCHDHVAIDLDAEIVEKLLVQACGWPRPPSLLSGDFIEYACRAIEAGSPKFDLVIGNPPFIRKHNFSDTFKDSLTKLSTLLNFPLSNLKNSWAAFLVGASKLVSDDGVVAFVLPYEIITVAYGHAVLNEMLKIFERIDLYVSDEKAFPQIDQDAVIFVGRRKASKASGLFVQRIRNMTNLKAADEHPIVKDANRPISLDLNAFLIDRETMPILRELQDSLPVFSKMASSSPGVVTGANDFFILKHADVVSRGLQAHVVPILKKQTLGGRSPLFTADDFEEVRRSEPCELFCIRGDVEDLDQMARSYVAVGAETEYPQRYKCRKRKNWYEVRLVKSAPGFFFKRSHGYPRICVNEANVHITDTAYGIHPKPGYSVRGLCFSFYNSITMLFAETNGRFYGGGVLELSPNELKGLPIIYHEPTDEEFKDFLEVHRGAGNDPKPILDFGDNWVKEKGLLKMPEIENVRRAWFAVRSHRLRHSNRAN